MQTLPSALPVGCDLGHGTTANTTIVLDTRVALSRVLKNARVVKKQVPEWRPGCATSLLSAVSGGQWTQTRRAQVPRLNVVDTR
eukprot:4282617-Karenia_brevis.AAC.1